MIEDYIKEAQGLQQKVIGDESLRDAFSLVVQLIVDALRSGHKLLIAGNGGSAADAQHFAAELVGRYKIERRAYPAIALTTDTSILTAWSNDYEFEDVFARQLEALGGRGDVFIAISTSGNSQNLIEAVSKAKGIGLKTVGLLGCDGGRLKELVEHPIIVPSHNTPRIQETHLLIYHSICEEVEKLLSSQE